MEYNSIKEYIDRVCEQIRLKKVHNKIASEIENHILEQKESFMKYGLDEEKSLKRAINEMGDAVIVGEKFNCLYKPKLNLKIVLFVSSISILFTLIQSIFNLYPEYISNSGNTLIKEFCYTLMSIFVMILVYYIDFSVIFKYSYFIYFINIILLSLNLVYTERILHLMFIVLPLFFTGILYTFRDKKYKGIFICLFYLFLPIIFAGIHIDSLISKYVNLFYIIVSLLTLLYAINKNHFNIKNRYLISFCIIISFIICCIAIDYFIYGSFYIERIITIISNTDKQGKGFAYNVLLEILRNCNFIGEMNTIPNTRIIESFSNNLVILKFIMKFGYISLFFVLTPLIIFFIYIYNLCKKQKAILSNLVCMTIFISLTFQFITSLIYNFFPIFPSIGLPFVSDGIIYKCYIMFNVGILLSIFKYKQPIIEDGKIFKFKFNIEI